MLKRIDSHIRRMNSIVLKVGVILLTTLLFYLDLETGPHFSFAIFYFADIWLAAAYVGGPYSYLIALITALARTYGVYVGYSPNEPIITGIWQLITNLLLHNLFCYLFSIQLQISHFLSPFDNPLLNTELSSFGELREFIFRPYVNRYWEMAERLTAIANHYSIIEKHIPFLHLAHDEFIELAQFDVGEIKLRIVIDRPKWMRREGEIAISFFFGIERIYTAMILLSGTKDHLAMIVGNLQGDGKARTDLYRELTKIMYGMRPRDFLVNVLKLLAGELGCKEILGISDDAHRSSHWFTKARKLATYDEIWLEHGGIKDNDSGFFRIPACIRKRSDQEIPPQKRALYRRRYQLLDDLQLTLKKLVSSPPQKRKKQKAT